MNTLRSKLARILEDERIEEIDKIKGDYKQASWGNQIRNYVLHPYKLVKDLRTNVESNEPEDVLDGKLDTFIEAQLRIQ
jgi:peptide chain release factor 2